MKLNFRRRRSTIPPVIEAGGEIAALVRELHQTVQRLQELTHGEVDSVMNPAGDSFLLQRAQEQLRQSEARQRESAEMQFTIINSLPAHIALLNHEGTILSVNEGWQQFSWTNSLDAAALGVGQNYLAACEQSRASSDEGPMEAAAGIRAVLAQQAPHFAFEYACHSPSERRWFRLIATPTGREGRRGAVVMHVDITDHKLKEEELVRKRSALQILFDLMPAMLCLKDTKNDFLLVNHRMAQASGLTVEEMEGKSAFEIYPKEAAKYYADDMEVIDSKTPKFKIMETLRDKQGRECAVQTDKVPVFDQGGKVIGLVVMVQDITERKRIEQRLKESETLLRTAGRTARLGGYFVELPSNRVVWSTEVCAIHEVADNTEPVLDEAINFCVSDSRAEFRRLFEKCARDGAPFDLETELITAKGRKIWVRALGEAVRDAHGNIHRVEGSFQDITERRLSEQALRDSEERFRQITDNISEVFWMTNPGRNRYLYVSPAFERIWGQSREDLYGNPDGWNGAIHAEDKKRVQEAMESQLKDGQFEEVYRIVRPDGSTRWIRDRAFPVRHTSGEIYRFVGVAEDITEMKRLETQFLRAQRMECIGTLAGGIAHDLNNILSPILISTTMLRNSTSLAELEKIVPLIETSARRGADVVRQLLIFGRGVESQRVSLQVRHLLREMVDMMRETFPKSITLNFRLPNGLWPVLGDATQLHQVLLNLCVNARDAMPEGGTLTLNACNVVLDQEAAKAIPEAKAGHFLKLEVSDTGTGIPPEIIGKVFEPFFTTKPVGQGTGLGLSTVLGIVKSHGGFIHLQSELGRGTNFEVYLAATPEAAEPLKPLQMDSPPPGAHGEWVLLVDDEPDILGMMGAILESRGYVVLKAKDGVEALDKYAWNSQSIGVVVTDLMMPRLDGLALVQGLKEMDPNVKVIVTSGSLDDGRAREKIVKLKDMGISQLLAKPYPAESLLTLLHEVLHQSAGGG
jgi:PAS domain S-box-containing protein